MCRSRIHPHNPLRHRAVSVRARAPLSIALCTIVCTATGGDWLGSRLKPDTVVGLKGTSGLAGLIAAEDAWISTNLGKYTELDFTYGARRVGSASPPLDSGRDLVVWRLGAKSRTVAFIYDKAISNETIEDLWSSYTSNFLARGRCPQLTRFEQQVMRSDTRRAIPYLIGQLADERQTKVVLVPDDTRVRDVVVLSLLRLLQYAPSRTWVFPGLQPASTSAIRWTRADADGARTEIRQWWESSGKRLAAEGQLAWPTRDGDVGGVIGGVRP